MLLLILPAAALMFDAMRYASALLLCRQRSTSLMLMLKTNDMRGAQDAR